MFSASENALAIIRSLRTPLEQLGRHDRDLEGQARRAASSTALNVDEGARREGKDRLQHYRISAGSAAELRMALRVACAWGYLEEDAVAEALRLLDAELAMLWRLTHPMAAGASGPRAAR